MNLTAPTGLFPPQRVEYPKVTRCFACWQPMQQPEMASQQLDNGQIVLVHADPRRCQIPGGN